MSMTAVVAEETVPTLFMNFRCWPISSKTRHGLNVQSLPGRF